MNINDKVHDMNELMDYNCGPDISTVVNNNPVCETHCVPMYWVDDTKSMGHFECDLCVEEDSQ